MKPAHYGGQLGGIDPLDLIAGAGPEVFEGFCRGNALKYIFRYKNKGGLADLEKAYFYLDMLWALENWQTFMLEKTKARGTVLPLPKELRERYGRK